MACRRFGRWWKHEVERVPVEGGRNADLGADAFQEQQIDVPVMGEVVVDYQGNVPDDSGQPIGELDDETTRAQP